MGQRGCRVLSVTPILLILISISSSVLGQWKSNPDGQLRPIRNVAPGAPNCGTCPDGYTREPPTYGACGRCIPATQSCAPGFVLVGNQCNPCPCPGTSNDRRFGTSCRVDVDGQITCECADGYTGRDCSQCAPGAVQSNQYPYNCVRVNQTNTQTGYCPPGNYCPTSPVNQVVSNPLIPPPPLPVTCPTNNCNPTQPCPIRPNPWPQPVPITPPMPCPVPIPGPGPILCPTRPTNPCPTNPCPTNPCPTNPCPTNPCPTNPCPTNPCPTNPCPTNPCPTNPCPIAPPCPIGPMPCPVAPPCPIGPMPCPVAPPCPVGPMPCPVPCPPCPVAPPCPIGPMPCPTPCPPCPVAPPCPPPCPAPPCPVPPPCPPCPTMPCPSPCPNPCPVIPPPPPCNPCPDPCPQCPIIPPCPQCPPCPSCPYPPPCPNPCPNPCPPCPPGDKCPGCPPPCRECPSCPNCALNVTCPDVGKPPDICKCDPRGTHSQFGETCFCKLNVGGDRCNDCKPGFFALEKRREEGCLQCWCSGVSDYCSASVFYRNWILPSQAGDCSIELTDESNSIVYTKNSNFAWDGKTARLSLTVSIRLFWALPSCFKGNRLTSYGGILRFSRMFTGSGGDLGPDNDVIIVGGNGARLYYSSFQSQKSGEWEKLEMVLEESTHMVFYKNGDSRVATRFDILEVLADVHLILIRATFTGTTMSTSIRDVALASVSRYYTSFEFVLNIEQCRCPTGYQGLSCESCAIGYYRDATDMTASVFGACKLCPCGRNALGCHLSFGEIICQCKPGFTGPRCQAREVITVTLDPFWVRDCAGTEIDFTCTFTTNSAKILMMRLGRDSEPATSPAYSKTLSKPYTLSSNLGRIKCEVVDQAGKTWATAYGAVEIEPCNDTITTPPTTITIITEEFICVDEGVRVVMTAQIFYFGSITIVPQWFREGEPNMLYNGPEFVIQKARLSDMGTYIVSAVQGRTVAVKHISLVVQPKGSNYISNDDPTVLMLDGNYDNSTYIFNKSAPANESIKLKPKLYIPPQKPRPGFFHMNGMQKDQGIVEGYPSVIVEPSEIRAKIGETVTLRCNASGEEPMKFYWKSGTSDYIPVHVRVSRGALIFKSVKKEDGGTYYCVAWNSLGQVTARANIIVDETPAPPTSPPLTIFLSKTHSEVSEGQHAYFDCSTNNPNVKPMWSRKDGELPKNSDVTKNGTLIIYRVRGVDAGIYKCKAMGPGGNLVEVEAILGFIPVESPSIPAVSLNPKSPLKARSGEQIRIECSASGFPSPKVVWSRSVEGAENVLVASEGNLTVYEIPHLTKADEGKYLCTATNSNGSKSESLSLVVDDAILCKAHEFRCKSGDQCVPKEDRCDNERDCKDGSDEHHCRKRSRREAS